MRKLFTFFFLLLCFYGNAQKQLVLCTTGYGFDRTTSNGINGDVWTYIQKWTGLTSGGQDAGVTAVRLHIQWEQYEPTLGNYQAAKLVAAMQAIKNVKSGMKIALHFSFLRPGSGNDSYFADEHIARTSDGTKAQDAIATTEPSIYSSTARTRFINFVNSALTAISSYYNDILYVQMGNSGAEEYIIPIVTYNGYQHSAFYEDSALKSWRTEYLPCRYPGVSTVTWGGTTHNISNAPPYDIGEWGDFSSAHGQEYHRFAAWGLMRFYKQFRDAVKSHNSGIKVLYFAPGFGTGQGNLRSMHTATLPAAYSEFDGMYTSEGTNTGDTWRKIMSLDVLKGTNPNKIAAIEFDPTDLGQQAGAHGVWPNMLTEWFARAYKHGADYIHFAMHFYEDEIDQLAPAIAAIKATYVTPNYTPPTRQNALAKNIFPEVFTGAFLFDNIWRDQGGDAYSTTDNSPKSVSMNDVGYWQNINNCAAVNPCDYTISGSGPVGNVTVGTPVTLSTTCGGPCTGITYAWSGNGISGSTSDKTFNAPGTAGTYTYTVTTSKSGCTNKTTNISITVISNGGGGGAYTQEFDNFFNTRLGSAYNNHVVAIVGCADNVLYTYNRGFTADQKLSVMSLSKWTTAAVIMMLVEEGKLQLSDKVGKYIPSWAINGKQDVTIRHLLAHNSGVPDQTPYDERTDMDLEGAVNNIALMPLDYTPGTQCKYSSAAFKVVARVAEAIENKRWKVIFAERLTSVSGMPNASYPNNAPYNENNPNPGYGVQVSLNEYANFMKMILRYGWFNGVNVMDSTSIAIMEQQHNVDGGFDNYGLGLVRDSDVNGIRQAWHPGASGCFTLVNRAKKYYAVILSQNGDPAVLASRDFKTFADQQLAGNICGSSSSQPCEYNVTPTAPGSTVNTGASVTLTSACTGQCSGVSYSWSGTGISGSNTSSSVTFNAPANAGTYTYTLTTSKSGCSNKTATVQLVVGAACNFNLTASNSLSGANLNLAFVCQGADCSGVTYAWSGNGISGNTNPKTIVAPTTAGTYTYTITASKSGCTNKVATTPYVVSNGSGTINQCVEAENSNGSGPVTGDPNASNGSTRGEENNYNHYVDYVITSVPSAGNYTATLTYYSTSPGPIVSVQVIGGSSQTVNLANSGSWNIVSTTQSFTVALLGGNNTIRIQGTGGGSCRQDKLCVVGTGGGCSPLSAPTLTASPSTITTPGGSSTLTATNVCSGGTITWSTGATGNSISVSPSSTTIYTAACKVGVCTSPATNVTVNVNQPDGSNPCNLVNQATIGTWNGLTVQARQYTFNGSAAWLIVTDVPGSSTDKHFPRGANFAARTDISWANGPVSNTCFAGGETGWGGLVKPSGITTPAGYATGTEPDGAQYLQQSCTAPSAPTLSASPSSIVNGANTQVTLSATGCSGGTINWSHSLGSGTSKTVSPTSPTTYTATCTIGSCVSNSGSVLVSVVPGTFSQCIESENGTGDAPVSNDPNASNGSTRGDENNYNKYVDYIVTGVPVAGNYTLTLQYYAANPSTVSVKVGSGTPQTVNLAATYSWNIVHTTQSFTVALGAASNTIRIQGTGGASCRQDKICVSNSGSSLMLDEAIPDAVANRQLSVYPNPNKGMLDVIFNLEKGKKGTIVITDLQGRIIHLQSVVGQGNHKERINLINRSSGMLFLQLKTDKKTEVKKIIIAR